MSPTIRNGHDELAVDTNEPRFSMGSGPVERRMATPERMADIAAERAAAERAAAVQAPVQLVVKPERRFPLPRGREARDALVIDALRTTSTVKAAGERLGVSENRVHQVLRDIRLAGSMPADLDAAIKVRAAHAASSLTGNARLAPAAKQVSTPPAATLPDLDIERAFDHPRTVNPPDRGVSHSIAVGDSEVVDKPVSEGENAPDDRGCLDQSNIGGAAMTVPAAAGPSEETYPQVSPRDSGPSWTTRTAVAAEEALAFDHEHGRLYDALKVAEERAELAGDDGIRLELRTLRRRIARHLEDRSCAA